MLKFGQKINSRGKEGFKYSNYLPSCQKSEKTNEPFLKKMLELMHGWADGQRQTTVTL